ncbi:MAG: ABC transporter ATP-binding protein [Nitrososphaerota archaeon]|nr:ABC transporter ATP-binding protein [Nitrososphaerota archaeon]
MRLNNKTTRVEAVKSVSFDVPSGYITTLLGPSGCGKTTTLRCIAGLEVPDSGEIRLGERVVFSGRDRVFVPPEKRGLGMVFQSYAVWPHMTVFDNVAYPLKLRKYPLNDIRKKVKWALTLVHLDGFEDRKATQLSGGQQQRVALARALVYEPNVILMDEPLSNLDAQVRENVRDELRTLLKELKITTLYVTHDQLEALALSDLVGVMKDGRLIEMKSPTELYENPSSEFTVEFIGRSNVFNGRWSYEQSVVDTEIGPIVVSRNKGDRNGNVRVVFRAESVELLSKEHHSNAKSLNVWRGRVKSVSFLGDRLDVRIDLESSNKVIKALVNVEQPIRQGDLVYLHVPPNKVLVFD